MKNIVWESLAVWSLRSAVGMMLPMSFPDALPRFLGAFISRRHRLGHRLRECLGLAGRLASPVCCSAFRIQSSPAYAPILIVGGLGGPSLRTHSWQISRLTMRSARAVSCLTQRAIDVGKCFLRSPHAKKSCAKSSGGASVPAKLFAFAMPPPTTLNPPPSWTRASFTARQSEQLKRCPTPALTSLLPTCVARLQLRGEPAVQFQPQLVFLETQGNAPTRTNRWKRAATMSSSPVRAPPAKPESHDE
jgi:hypothetical protein